MSSNQALPFDKSRVNFDDVIIHMTNGIPPKNAEEYLARVQLEALSIPNVSVVSRPNINHLKQPQNMACFPKSRIIYKGTEKWRRDSLSEFRELRSKLASWTRLNCNSVSCVRTPKLRDCEAWTYFCLGDGINEKGHPPMVQLVTQLDQVTTKRLLMYQACNNQDISFSISRAAWVYALLLHIELPLDCSSCSNMRQILRECCAQCLKRKGDSAVLRALELLVLIISKYFGQNDCLDETIEN